MSVLHVGDTPWMAYQIVERSQRPLDVDAIFGKHLNLIRILGAKRRKRNKRAFQRISDTPVETCISHLPLSLISLVNSSLLYNKSQSLFRGFSIDWELHIVLIYKKIRVHLLV